MEMRTLTAVECTKVLERNHIAHLGCARDGQPYVVPVYYCYSANGIFAFSLPGKKVDFMRANPRVSMIVEERGHGREWRSVVIDGSFEELSDEPRREQAWHLLSQHVEWWVPGGLKPSAEPIAHRSEHLFYRIGVEEMSGREARE